MSPLASASTLNASPTLMSLVTPLKFIVFLLVVVVPDASVNSTFVIELPADAESLTCTSKS
jgi:hypothetical protein